MPKCPVTDKTGYTKWKHAQKDMRTLARLQGETLSRWNIYTCQHCNFLHVGHKPWYLET